jgi:hypothetical protein
MSRWEVRFYDAPNGIKLTIELEAIDRRAAEAAAILYLEGNPMRRAGVALLQVGVVRELPS